MEHAQKAKELSFKLNDFEVRLLRNDTELRIKAEHVITLKNFEAAIPSENVKETTSHIFPDIEFLYLGLLDAFEKKDPTVSLTLSDEAQLTYLWERMIRDRKMVEKFVIGLVEVEMDSSKRKERQMERLLKKSDEQEERIEALEKENKQLAREVATMKELIEKLLGKKESLTFDPSCVNAKSFIFSNGDQTVELIESNSNFKPVLVTNVLPKGKKTKFSVRADSVRDGYITVGICSSTLKGQNLQLYYSSDSYSYVGNSTGGFLTANKRTDLQSGLFTNGSIITVVVDLSSYTLSFEQNSKEIYTTKISSSLEYYPYVELYYKNDKVTLL